MRSDPNHIARKTIGNTGSIGWISSLLICIVFFACQSNPRKISQEVDETDEFEKACYAYMQGKDTVRLLLEVDGDSVSGDLTYQLFEKDRNQGFFVGVTRGDTIFGKYTFSSEGSQSVRDVVFLHRDSSLVEGHGNMREEGNQLVFENRNSVRFSGLVLQKMPCP